MAENPKSEYEAPSVEEVETEDAPSVTAAGADSVIGTSDRRLKRSVRSLESAIKEGRDG
jgi:hypothetical protein